MPPWFEMNNLYEFKFANDSDESEYVNKTSCKQLLIVEPSMASEYKAKYGVMVETKENFMVLGSTYCQESTKWIAALRKAKQTSEEIFRTKAGKMMVNIDPYIKLFKNKDSDAITRRSQKELQEIISIIDPDKVEVKLFLKIATEAQTYFQNTLDALQATRPFFPELLKALLQYYHAEWTQMVKTFWNKRFKEFDVKKTNSGSPNSGVH